MKKLLRTFYFPTIMTGADRHVSFLSRHKTANSRCLENADLKTWDRGQKENYNFVRVCLPRIVSAKISTEHCAYSTTAFGHWWTGFALFCYAMITGT